MRSDGYDPNWHYLKRLQRWYNKKCEDEEEWKLFCDSLQYDEKTSTYIIIFKGVDEDCLHIEEFLNQRPMEDE